MFLVMISQKNVSEMGDWEGKQHLKAPARTWAVQGNIWKNNP